VPRILRDSGLYGYFRENPHRNFRWRSCMPRKISFGLRFLMQNRPGLAVSRSIPPDRSTLNCWNEADNWWFACQGLSMGYYPVSPFDG